ncbi:hypothetical protein ACFYP4_02425 [Streptomyces sp. NPDC005551]|uniref:hypothetical protein n=1 Tax=Streptomyces sp. NPDC005551 TaxID=3364725 RepID=UPI0036971D0F
MDDTLATFSYETNDALALAGQMVLHNRRHRTPDIDLDMRTVTGADARVWDVAWAFKPSTGAVIVCWWSPAKP